MTETLPEPIGPVPGEERITVIDCLRGAALFGILMANMRGFHAPLAAYFQPDLLWTWPPDRITQAFVDWLISGKFITIFAALFGIGFAIQMDRAAARGLGVGFYSRRMLGLLLIGLAHSFLLWWGDILVPYAVCGLFLPLFRRRSQKGLLIWANALYWFLFILILGMYVATVLGAPPPPPPDVTSRVQETIQAYAHGSFRDVFMVRAREWAAANSFVLLLTRILAIFLFGVYLWRQGYLREPSAHLDWWRKAQRIGLTLGILGNAACVFIEWYFHASPARPSLAGTIWFALLSLAVPALSLGYAATIVVLWQNPVWQQRLRPFSYVGRMALTNYLLQSFICTTIFYSYGLGLYGRVGPLIDIFIAIVIYGLQVPFSRWWLAGHRYGPMEWVWRRLTYGRIAARQDLSASTP